MRTIILLALSNVFMTFAWYGHLKILRGKPVVMVILISWGIAFFEYVLQVPANRMGYGLFTLQQLKVIQEILTMSVFAGFALLFMRERLTLNFLWASLCLIAAAFFMFRSAV